PWVALLCTVRAPVGEVSPAAGLWRRALEHGAIGCALAALAVPVFLVAMPSEEGPAPAGFLIAAAAAGVAAAAIGATLVRRRSRDSVARAAAAAALLVTAMGLFAAAQPMRIPATKPLWEAVASRRAAGEELGMALPETGDWGLFPWYARE